MLSFLLTVALLLVGVYWLLVVSTLQLMSDIGQSLVPEGSKISVQMVKEANGENPQLRLRLITA